MRRVLFVILVSAVTLFGAGMMRAGTPTPSDVAGEFVVYLLADNYDAAYALLDPALQANLPQTRLLELWSSARFYGGASASLNAMRADGDTAVVTVEFERLAYEVEISVDAEGQIYRLFFTQIPLAPSAITPTASPTPTVSPTLTPTLTLVPATGADAQAMPSVRPPTGANVQAAATAIVPTPPQPSTPTLVPTLPTEPFAALGVRVARALGAGDYDAVVALFHPQLAAALPAAVLEQVWTDVTTARGEYVDVASYLVDVGSRTVVVRIDLARAGDFNRVELYINVSIEGQIVSLYLV